MRAAGVLIVAAMFSPLLAAAPAVPPKLPRSEPAEVGLDSDGLAKIDALVAGGLKAGQMPGCVVLVGRRGKIAWLKAYGNRQIEPEPLPMTADTLFDLASLTKPIATATSVMLLVERGQVRLDDPVARYIPEFAAQGKQRITVRQLLTHQAGLIADNPLSDYQDGPENAWARIFALTPRNAPGEKFVYSDVGFLVLGELVRRISGQDLRHFSHDHVFGPLGMAETGFLPGDELRRRAAPTERREGRWMQGEVHDPRSYALGGVAGHAGLFSTAEDLAVYAQMLLGRGQYGGVRILAEATVQQMFEPQSVSSGFRGLGWDIHTGYSINRGSSFSPRAVGHGGFTGTGLWIDPQLELFVIFLSNRVHPHGKGSVNRLIGQIGTVVGEAVRDRPPPGVLTGIDVLKRDGFALLRGRSVGLITNHTGVDRQGVPTSRLLRQAEGVRLVAIFSPEHGLQGTLDTPRIADSRDRESGLPVYSLYGETRRPTEEMLQGIDTLVFDMQDIGSRFYTYIATLGNAIEEAARRNLRFVVLDRPNPIGGSEVDGPMLDAGRETFVAFHRLPVRHGMTVGELAQMFKHDLKLDLNLAIVRVEGWPRDALFDATGLTWINPSPNIRSLTEALLYPGIGLLETTNVSVGRGTPTPFEIVGAPWIDAAGLQEALAAAGLPGVTFRAVDFVPNASKFAGKTCHGVGIAITDRSAFRPLRTGLEIARQLRLRHPDAWAAAAYDRLLLNRQVHAAILAGKPVADIEALYRPALEEFLQRRWRFLLYP